MEGDLESLANGSIWTEWYAEMTHVLSDDNFSGIFGEKGYSFIAERMNGVVQGGSRLLLVPILLVLSVVGSVFDLVVCRLEYFDFIQVHSYFIIFSSK